MSDRANQNRPASGVKFSRREVLKVGEKYPFKILLIEPKERRMSLGLLSAVVLFLAALALSLIHAQEAARKAPPTRADNVKEMLHGVEVVDPCRWLEDQNSPENRAWIDAQRTLPTS